MIILTLIITINLPMFTVLVRLDTRVLELLGLEALPAVLQLGMDLLQLMRASKVHLVKQTTIRIYQKFQVQRGWVPLEENMELLEGVTSVLEAAKMVEVW